MKLPKYFVSISGIRSNTKHIHVLEDYCAQNATIAAYMVAENEIGIPFEDNENRSEFEWEDVVEEFNDYGYSVLVALM